MARFPKFGVMGLTEGVRSYKPYCLPRCNAVKIRLALRLCYMKSFKVSGAKEALKGGDP